MHLMNPEKTRIVLWIFLVLTTTFALSDSMQGLMFPLLIAVYLFKDTLTRIFNRLPLPLAFFSAGLAAGLLIEVFAILENSGLPPAERVLLHPDPAADLFIAFFWYGLFTLTWYLLLRKIAFPKKAVYILSALYGVFTEYGILLGIFANPLIGGLLALIITAAYGIFPFVAYLLTEKRFGARTLPHLRHYFYAAASFLLYWVLMGNLIYNPLITLFPKGL
jgi:hypothetical protein